MPVSNPITTPTTRFIECPPPVLEVEECGRLIPPVHGPRPQAVEVAEKCVLALDIATSTGWAARLHDGQIVAGTICHNETIRPCHRTRPRVLAAARANFDLLLDLIEPDLIIYEAPFMRGAGSRLLWGLCASVECQAAERGLELKEKAVKSVRQQLLGDGAASKDDVQAWLSARGYTFANHDEADALALLLTSIN